ncbi:MAG: YCF48-related protein [Bacteroidota bacterium]|nr:YCF48-related protein [Bacteroidota bacterium]MDP4229454.1 YCF48-related protein [Bacteroidota bacterium]MDP4236420.1 YCF48-related protein [Bacteroidota bacterium]
MSRKLGPSFILLFFVILIAGCSKTVTEPNNGAPARGVLSGVILDGASGDPLPGATITSEGRTAITNSSGTFEIDSLLTGKDAITISKLGYDGITDTVIIITDHLTQYTGSIFPSSQGLIGSWEQVTSGTLENLSSACYATKTTIYACGFDGTLLRSSDAGQSWSLIPTPTQENLYCVHFSDANKGVIMGNNGAIYTTADAGKTWSASPDGNGYAFRNVSFVDALHGYAVGGVSSFSCAIVKTTDGGATWSDESSNLLAGPLYGVHFTSSTTGFVGTYDGYVFKTTDGGTTWNKVYASNAWVRSIFFTAPSLGTFVGTVGTIQHTNDGGLTWSEQGQIRNISLNSVAYSDFKHGLTAGESGSIYLTRDGGANWLDQTVTGLNLSLLGVALADSTHGVIVGENGTILKPIIK